VNVPDVIIMKKNVPDVIITSCFHQ